MEDYRIPTVSEHVAAIQEARRQTAKRMYYARAGEWFGVIATLTVATTWYSGYRLFQDEFLNWPLSVRIGVVIIACAVSLTPAMFAVLCDHYRDNIQARIDATEHRIDIVVGVHTAMREYLGECLPEYSKHLQSFGLAEELMHITDDMSQRFTRAHQTTLRALEQLEQAGGLVGLKHESIKAQALAEFIQTVLEIATRHDTVVEFDAADRDLKRALDTLEMRLMAAE